MDDKRKDEIVQGVKWALDREEAMTAGTNYPAQFSDVDYTELLAWCVRRDLDPREEAIAIYQRQGKMIIHTPVETLIRRACRTGLYRGYRQERYVDKGEVVCVRVAVRREGWDPVERVGNVLQWQKNADGKNQWGSNPEHMTAEALLRKCLQHAFPESLGGLDDGGDPGPTPEAPRPPTASQAAALTRVASGLTVSPADARAAAQAVLRQRGSTASGPPTPEPPPADDLGTLGEPEDRSAPTRVEAAARRGFGLAWRELTEDQQGKLTRYLDRDAAPQSDVDGIDHLLEGLRVRLGSAHVAAVLEAAGVKAPYWPRFPRPADCAAILEAAERLDKGAA